MVGKDASRFQLKLGGAVVPLVKAVVPVGALAVVPLVGAVVPLGSEKSQDLDRGWVFGTERDDFVVEIRATSRMECGEKWGDARST